MAQNQRRKIGNRLKLFIAIRDDWKCFWCDRQFDPKKVLNKFGYFTAQKFRQDSPHIDHILPVIKGGNNDPENLVLSCMSCNLTKYVNIWHKK